MSSALPSGQPVGELLAGTARGQGESRAGLGPTVISQRAVKATGKQLDGH